MSQREEPKESVLERSSATSIPPGRSEKLLEHKDRNGLDKSKSNLEIKATMARELSLMGLNIEAIGRILRTDTAMVEEWIYLDRGAGCCGDHCAHRSFRHSGAVEGAHDGQ